MNKIRHYVYLILMGCPTVVFAQNININAPTYLFTQVCASPGLNNYNVQIPFTNPENLGAGNVFTLELSDDSGSFANAIPLGTSTATTSPAAVSFALPATTLGGNYRIRARSSAPAAVGIPSASFYANYLIFNQPFFINGLVQNVTICAGSDYTITVDYNGDASSPVHYPGLTYKWYKGSSIIPGAVNPSLTVTESGSYYATIDYGNCPGGAYSNAVNVIVVPGLTPVIDSGGPPGAICPDSPAVLTCSVQDPSYAYQWYRDAFPISGATTFAYTAAVTGAYYVTVDNSSCTAQSNLIDLAVQDITVAVGTPGTTIILPGEEKILTATTDAQSPEYQWYRNNSSIDSETSNVLTINQSGDYKISVRQTVGCLIEKNALISIEAPSGFMLTVAHEADYMECESTSDLLGIETFKAVTPMGEVDLIGQDIGASYVWLKNDVPVSGATADNYLVAVADDNDQYNLSITVPNYTTISSNYLDVKLKIDDTVTISTTDAYCDGSSSVTLHSSITTPEYSYNWFREGADTAIGNETTLVINTPGTYRLEVAFNGCILESNALTITPFDAAQVTADAPDSFSINEGDLRTVTAAGAQLYAWFKGTVQLSNSASLTISEEGTYLLRATSGSCETTKIFQVTVNDNTNPGNVLIPNVVTPNGDGINDQWILPNAYVNNPEVEVVIHNSNGEVVFRTFSYQNNWPVSSMVYSHKNNVFYYKIFKNGKSIKQGSITIIQ